MARKAKADQYGRPLCEVVSVRFNAYGCPVELLECGHDLLGLARDSGEWRGHRPRPRRRCDGCADDAMLRGEATRRAYHWHRRSDGTIEIRRGRYWAGWYSWTHDYNDQKPGEPWPPAEKGAA